ncbi:hypothetical protein [Modestobacter roseus]|uniref:Uncharacterized protein n=1 Tax=Modestobacter roseus TaxID=1181884 RepID=A0A562ILZ4_9ACTN|nr:hypothetical protein [Modestobacter roseus]MQA34567.1 hypothetical protein [Modestobacter roseus]TWH71624.1 hypothetical protein JD78_00122 [Modestobacter roseus]
MTDSPFGSPAGLLRRLVRTEVDPDDVRDAVDHLAGTAPLPGLRLSVADGPRGELLVVEEAGRTSRVLIGELAAQMTRARVAGTPDEVLAALRRWLDHRPVPDAVAAAAGVAVLDWAEGRAGALGWRVVVRRAGLLVPWRPSRNASLPDVHHTRSAAWDRSLAVEGALRVEGPVGLWTTTSVPGADSAVLVAPGRLLGEMRARGMRVRDVHAVVTPGRPVACAEAGVARRLVAEAADLSVVLPWRRIPDLGWS